MKQLVRQALHISAIPQDLKAVTTIDSDREIDPHRVGLTHQNIDAIWRAALDLYRTGTQPGIQLCLRRRGEIVMQRAIGHARGNGPEDARNAPKTLLTPETPICYFSASKAVTALLMHILAEENLVNLNDPVSHYMPEFAQHGKGAITLHQILSHRGGIPGLPRNAPLDTLWDRDEIWRLLCQAKPITVDGSTVAYHAITGGFVLQRVLEKVTGCGIETFLDEKLRQPMGMRRFTYGIESADLDQLAINYATGPRPTFPLSWVVKRALGANLETVAQVTNDPRFQEAVIPAGNLVGTAEEMSRFFQMMLNGGEWNGRRICHPDTIRRAIQPFGAMQLDRTLMVPMRFSAGFMLGNDPVGIWGQQTGAAFGHVGLINKWCWADPVRDISISLMTTGIPILAHHLPALARFVWTVGHQCPAASGSALTSAA